MATSSIQKEFLVKDAKAFEKLKRELSQATPRTATVKNSAVEKGKEKLASFVFR